MMRETVLTGNELFKLTQQDGEQRILRIDQGVNGLVFTILYQQNCDPETVEAIRIWRIRNGFG
jgi:hypothetical protein